MSDSDQNAASATGRRFGDLWLADLIDALATITVGTEAQRRAWALELLGLSRQDDSDRARDSQIDQSRESFSADAEPHTLAPTPDASAEAGHGPRPYQVVRTRPQAEIQDTPQWLASAERLPDVDHAQVTVRPTLDPLFPPDGTRAILATGLGAFLEEGDIDVVKVIDDHSRLRPVTTLHRTRFWTLRLGIQLLIDRKRSNWPFLRDQDRLHAEILDVVGHDRVEALYFEGNPLRGVGAGTRRTWRAAYAPPPPGTPVLLLTDLGLARCDQDEYRTNLAHWVAFADLVRDSDCPLVAFVPFGAQLWPRALHGRMQILCWDRSATVSAARSARLGTRS